MVYGNGWRTVNSDYLYEGGKQAPDTVFLLPLQDKHKSPSYVSYYQRHTQITTGQFVTLRSTEMKVFTISLAFAGTALADPSTPQPFDVMALRSASPIHFASLSASQGSLFLNLPQQGATCNGSNNRATFYLQGSDLFLYSESGNAQQQIFVDRSGLGTWKHISPCPLIPFRKRRAANGLLKQVKAKSATLQLVAHALLTAS